ncbi:hypothetical protein FQZ97_378390 [compost metagenome]
MCRLAPERFYATESYRPLGLSETLGFIISQGEKSRAVLSLLQLRETTASSEEERQLLCSAAPVVEQVVRGAWEVHQRNLYERRSVVSRNCWRCSCGS